MHVSQSTFWCASRPVSSMVSADLASSCHPVSRKKRVSDRSVASVSGFKLRIVVFLLLMQIYLQGRYMDLALSTPVFRALMTDPKVISMT